MGASIHSGDVEFMVPSDYEIRSKSLRIDENGNKYIRVPSIRWFTNLEIKKRPEDLILYKKYTPEEYPKYDNYDAINVDKTKDIPMDYAGAMGVPITFLDKYNPEQFEIIKFGKGDDDKKLGDKWEKSILSHCNKKQKTMKIELKEITVRELTDSYEDNANGGVVGFGGKPSIFVRPINVSLYIKINSEMP